MRGTEVREGWLTARPRLQRKSMKKVRVWDRGQGGGGWGVQGGFGARVGEGRVGY